MLTWLRWEARRRNPTGPSAERIPVDARILAVQPDHLGGVLTATPALRLIKETLPTAHLTVLAGPWGADVAEHCTAVDRVRTCRFTAFDRQRVTGGFMGRLAPYSLLLDTAAELREERFDIALCLVADFWSAALTAIAGIPRRLGFETPDAAPFLTRTLSLSPLAVGKAGQTAPKEHVSAAQLRQAQVVVALTGREAPGTFDERMQYEPRAADRAEAVRVWHAHDLEGTTPVVAIHPAPGGPAKRWPVERFAFVADHLVGRFGARIIVTGGPDDVDEARAFAAACRYPPTVLAGRTTFGALAAIYERCRFAMGTDNGAMHLATARRVPTIRLFGPVDHQVWSGWTGAVDNLPTIFVASPRPCSPCHRLDLPEWESVAPGGGNAYPCMQDISVEDVIRAVEEMWARTA